MARERIISTRSIIEPRLRIKQRDYTIPVRLNQLPLVQSPSKRIPIRCSILNKKNMTSQTKQIERSSDITTSNTMIQNKISFKSMRFISSCRAFWLAIAIISCMICLIGKSSLCDNNSQTNQALSTSLQSASQKLPSTSHHHNQKRKSASTDHKEHLLSYLTDNIERQHFKMKPSRAFVHQRPSKFDSGDDLNESEFTSIQSSNRYNKIAHKNSNPLAAADKVDQGMRHIMQMHEHAHHPPPPTAASSSTPSDLSTSASSSFVNKWRDISRAPSRVASTLINPSKMMTQVLSYISPLIGASKLIDPAVLNQKLAIQNSTASSGSTIVSRLRLNPFTGRSISNQAALNNLFGFERNKQSLSPFVTQSPQTAFLARPDFFKSSLTAAGRHFTTPSTSLFDSLMGESASSNKDLLADSSSTIETASPVTVDNESSKGNQEDSNNQDQQAKSILKPDSASRLWLKNSANQVAQNYLQNSFRGLLTLSQLPILPTGSVSSAPSELEKNRLSIITKLKGTQTNNSGSKHPIGQKQQQHQQSQNFNQSLAQSQRRRALDELYRYAYILSTGIGRKRDPLVALGSSPPRSVVASSMLNQKQSVFSQRSKGLLSSIQNQKQLLDYAKSLRSALLPSALNKAKPRGVMWDMATDPSLAVTVFHLLERASVALPLGKC